jgi:LacI family transcriptional regulator
MDVGIPDSTRQTVIAAAKELGYRPNLAARSLVKGKTNAMGLWITRLSAMVYFTWVECLQAEVRSHDYELIISERGGAEIDSHKGYSHAPEWPVDGLFAYGVEEYLDGLPNYIPTVIFGPYEVKDLDYVGMSLYKAELEAVQHLVSGGRKRIVFLKGTSKDMTPPEKDERYDAYTEVMEQAGLQNEYFPILGVGRLQAYESMKEYVRSNKLPEAFVCYNDDIAIGTLRALKESGVRVPEDVALIGCDGLEETDYHQPRISTIVNPFEEISKIAWEFMENRLNDWSIPRQVAMVDAHFVSRESSSPISTTR